MEKRIGAQIRKLRLLRGLSQENIAEAIGMSTGNFGKIERGEITLSIRHLDEITRALNIDVADLYHSEVQLVQEPQAPYTQFNSADFNRLVREIDDLKKEVAQIKTKLDLP